MYFKVLKIAVIMTAKQNNPLKNFYCNKLKPQVKLALDDIRHPSNHPKTTAFSMALGMFIGIFIPMGLQVWTLAILLFVMRFNIVMATLVTLISNPFTFLPVYYAGITVGEKISGEIFPWQYFDKFIEEPKWDYIVNFGSEGAFIFLGGLLILGISLAIVTYFLAFRFAIYLKRKSNTALQD